MKVALVILISCIIQFIKTEECIPRTFPDGIVCVCNSTYCDSITVNIPPKGKFRSYITSKDGKRFNVEDGKFVKTTREKKIELQLDTTKTYQKINGFGGAFTDSTGININLLSIPAREKLMQAYFSKSGSSYSLCRVPIGGTDFSTRPYTLADTPGDIALKNFSLAKEDVEYKIPYMKKALEINPQLKFFSGAWSAPAWMKTNNDLRGFLGRVKSEYYQVYANYLVKFLESYQSQGLPIWAISTGNEPLTALFPMPSINIMWWDPVTSANWLVNNLGPSIENSNSNETIILALDDERFVLPWWIDGMYNTNELVDTYISGIAVHWYADSSSSVDSFDETHDKYPDKFLLMTEACSGFPPNNGVKLGSWERGEDYIKSIIEDINHWVTGWIDWNLALDKTGGPNWINNNVDSPIIVNPETDEFFKQPMYYALAHVSKFVPPGSIRIKLTSDDKDKIYATAFKTPADNIVCLLYNSNNEEKAVKIVNENGKVMAINMHPLSIRTIVYQQ